VRELSIEGNTVTAIRDIEAALEVVKVNMPLVVSVTSEINKPRRAPLAQILRASRKPMRVLTLKDLELDAAKVGSAASAIQVVSNLAPQQERKGIILEGDPDETVSKLVDALRKEGALP
jgi:electron transfer flavoprotein beta subunit